ncbi:DUF481 domain-containing protein [Sulfurimonas sp.]|nr:DUF481 domain-containing protein [Sulfurimonas sp.]
MRKIILALLVTSSIVMAADEAQIKQNISDVKAQIAALNKNLALLEAQLPVAKKVETKKDNSFITHTELGYIATSGNTNTDTFNIDAKAKKKWNKHSLEIALLMQYGTENDVENKNRILTELSYGYELSEKFTFDYLFGYKIDKFSGYESQMYTGPGMKYKAIKSDTQNLSLEGSILYSMDITEDTYHDGSGNPVSYPYPAGAISNNDGSTKSYGAYRAKVIYDWQLLKNLKFGQELSYRSEFSDAENYFAYSKSSLSSKLSDIFSAGISYQADYINQPADGKTSTDKTFTFNLIVDY